MNPIEQRIERLARLTDFYNTKLKELVSRFYQNQSSSVSENQEVLKHLNKQWKQIVYKGNLLNKGLGLRTDAFENTITHNHFIMVILEKQPRLTSEYLNTKDDSLLQELSENNDQLEAFTKNYLYYLKLQQAKKKQTFKTAE